MRIAINTLAVTDENEGIRTVLLGLVGALLRIDHVNRYRIIASEENRMYFDALGDRVDITVIGGTRRGPLVRSFTTRSPCRGACGATPTSW